MSVHEARIRFRVGDLELEYQGPSSYIESGLIDMFEKVLRSSNYDGKPAGQAPGSTISQEVKSVPQLVDSEISLATMISRLGAETGADLVFMSAAHLAVCQGRNRFSRADIHDNAKLAVGHYKKSVGNNLTRYLGGLLKEGRLNQYSDNSYALPESHRQVVSDGLSDCL